MNTFILNLINRKLPLPILTGQNSAAEWTRTLAQAHAFLDSEERLEALTRARSTLDTELREAA